MNHKVQFLGTTKKPQSRTITMAVKTGNIAADKVFRLSELCPSRRLDRSTAYYVSLNAMLRYILLTPCPKLGPDRSLHLVINISILVREHSGMPVHSVGAEMKRRRNYCTFASPQSFR